MESGDPAYIDVLRKQGDFVYDHMKIVDGRAMLPHMYGDPRGYSFNGEPEFYQYTPNILPDRLTETYPWSMDRDDLVRLPLEKEWIAFLEGADPGYPVHALRRDLEFIRSRVERMRTSRPCASHGNRGLLRSHLGGGSMPA